MTSLSALVLPPARAAAQPRGERAVGAWLFCICFMLLVMISLGGATRLTGSGLSIMEWAPLMGTLPPLSDAEWNRLFALYQQIPQYQLVNHGFGLAGFKSIFWLEWTHRLWGRLTAVVFLLPLILFAVRGRISGKLALRLALLFVLGGLQGAVGWFMVSSGFAAGSTAVSAYRLVVHLVLALTLYAAILWTALELWRPRLSVLPPGRRAWLGVAACCVALTIVAGGFVAGLKAGLIYNTFPLMGDRLVPAEYGSIRPFWRNFTENLAAVQFDHRVLATLTGLVVLAAVARLWRGSVSGRGALGALGGLVVVQYGLGVSTLIHVVPVPLAALHQAVAILLLTAALVSLFVHRTVQPAP